MNDNLKLTKVTIEHEDCLYILYLDSFVMEDNKKTRRMCHDMEGVEVHQVLISGEVSSGELYMREKVNP